MVDMAFLLVWKELHGAAGRAARVAKSAATFA